MAERDITSLLKICPEIVIGKYLAVTSIESGPLRLSEEEKLQGWWTSETGRVFQATSLESARVSGRLEGGLQSADCVHSRAAQ